MKVWKLNSTGLDFIVLKIIFCMENHNFYSKLSTQKNVELYYFITQNEGEIIGKQYHFQFKLIIISET